MPRFAPRMAGQSPLKPFSSVAWCPGQLPAMPLTRLGSAARLGDQPSWGGGGDEPGTRRRLYAFIDKPPTSAFRTPTSASASFRSTFWAGVGACRANASAMRYCACCGVKAEELGPVRARDPAAGRWLPHARLYRERDGGAALQAPGLLDEIMSDAHGLGWMRTDRYACGAPVPEWDGEALA
jgi:hypothetical protein